MNVKFHSQWRDEVANTGDVAVAVVGGGLGERALGRVMCGLEIDVA